MIRWNKQSKLYIDISQIKGAFKSVYEKTAENAVVNATVLGLHRNQLMNARAKNEI